VERGYDLWVAASFGTVALVFLLRPNLRFRPIWWLLPLGWTLLIWGLFALRVRELAHPSTYFELLARAWIAVFAAGTWLVRQAGVSQPWLKALGFYALAFLLLANCNHPLAENYNNLIRFSATFPHYFLSELCVASLAAGVAAFYARFRPRGSYGWLDVLGLGLIIVALVDLRLTQVMGVRLGWDVLHFGNSPSVMWRMAKPYIPGLIGVLLATALGYAVAVRGVGRVLRRRINQGKPRCFCDGGWLAVGGFALLAVLGMAIAKPDDAEGQSVFRLLKSSPLGKRAAGRVMSPEEFRRTATELGINIPDGERTAPTARARPNLNVLLILQESAYNRYCSLFGGTEETQPLLAKYRDRMEIFPNFFSSFQGSIQARFATFTGLYPVGDFNIFTLNRVGVRSIFEVLHEKGYSCSLFYSSFADYTGFRSFLNGRDVDELYDADNMPGERKAERVSWGLREDETLAAIRMQIRKQATRPEPFFLTYIPAAPHYPYDNIPETFRKFPRVQLGDYTPSYLNEMLFMDWVVTTILDELKETGVLDRTLVVLTSDHGEMLGGEDNPVGHGWKVTPELANVPLILLNPCQQGYRVNYTIGSQVDLLPTLLDELGIRQSPDELYQGCSLRATAATGPARRLIYLSSYKEYAMISGDDFWKGDRANKSDSEGNWNGAAFQISNNGPQTLFTPSTNKAAPAVAIRRFDKFQENLLRNYTFYRDSLRNPPSTASGRVSK